MDEGLRLVEWPDRAPQLAASADLRITLKYEQQGRHLDIEGISERGKRLASKLIS